MPSCALVHSPETGRRVKRFGEYLLPDESRPLPLLFGVPSRTPAALADCG